MASIVLGSIGSAIGGAVGGPLGAQIGWAIGSAIGGALDPPKTQKQVQPLTDLRVVGAEYGAPIPYLRGASRIAGQMWWNTNRRPLYTTTTTGGGKGGGKPKQETTTITYEMDCLYGLTDNEIIGVTRIWDNGDLIYNADAEAPTASVVASGGSGFFSVLVGSLVQSVGAKKEWTRMTVYTGASDQLPDPTYEAAVGAGAAPAYRGRGTVFIEGLQLGQSGSLRNLTFEVVVDGSDGPLVRGFEAPVGFTTETFAGNCIAEYNPINREVWMVDDRYNYPTGPARIVIFDLETETFLDSVSFPDFGGGEYHGAWSNIQGAVGLQYVPEWGQFIVATAHFGDNRIGNWSLYDAGSRAYLANFADANSAWYTDYSFGQWLFCVDPVRNVAVFFAGKLSVWSLTDGHVPGGKIVEHTGAYTYGKWGTATNDGTIYIEEIANWVSLAPGSYAFSTTALDSDGKDNANGTLRKSAYDPTRDAFYYWSVGVTGPESGGFRAYLKKFDCATKTMSRLSAYHFAINFVDLEPGGAPTIGQNQIHYAADIDKLVIVTGAGSSFPGHVTFIDPSDGSYTKFDLTPGGSQAFKGFQFAYAPGVVWGCGDYPQGGTRPDLNEARFNALTNTCPTVADVVTGLCVRAGLTAGQIDVTALASITRGVCCMPVSQVASARQALETLMAAYFFEMVVSDKLYFVPRGGAPVVTLEYAELAAQPA